MHVADPAPAQRLERLEGFLREDPENAQLLAEVCEQALACGAFDRADLHLATARRLKLETPGWLHLEGRLCLARGDWQAALAALQRLASAAGDHPGVAHDVAYAHWRSGHPDQATAALAPWLSATKTPDVATRAAVQALWLRASHQAGHLDEAWAWVAQAAEAGELQPAAAGVASLMAVDLGLFAEAAQMASAAIEAGVGGQEALVARATVAMAEGDTVSAFGALRPALEVRPDDGRTWSTLGMASLQARDVVGARSQFARASQLMPGHIGTWHGLGWSCLLLSDRAGALSAFQRALALDENFAESHGAVGLVLALGRRTEQAEYHLLRAERLDRRNLTSRYARALARGQAQDAQALRHLAEKLLDRPGLFGRRLIDNVDALEKARPSRSGGKP